MRGGRASRAGDILRKNGYESEIQSGGITQWKEKGRAVVEADAPPAQPDRE